MAKYKCVICGYTYDEDREGKPFADLPKDWTCPTCGVDKTQFKKI
ncbi:MAG: rubredoxin [Mycoplasmataceae bacterium]|jgi:rubredoxin|nr:rubredoxin [Mycoplasmataceae bacterium]